MTADDDFLSRWSQRKRAAAEADKVPAAKTDSDVQRDVEVPKDSGREIAEASFDITKLPPVDSINSLTDVRDFLRAGVPADLARAALRRAWSADPAIRDFIGLAENAWDFTDPNAMPGFGPLEATDNVRQMVEQVISRISNANPPGVPKQGMELSQPSGSKTESASPAAVHLQQPDEDHSVSSVLEQKLSGEDVQVDAAPQQPQRDTLIGSVQDKRILRRTHGGALPH